MLTLTVLAHERLSIVGVDSGAQPLTNADESIALAVNGEIYNHRVILLGVQDLLDDPNPDSPAQADAYNLFKKDRGAYEAKIKRIVKDNPAP